MIKLQERNKKQKFRQQIELLLATLFGEACEAQISSLLRSKQPFLYADSEDDELNHPHEWRCFSIMEAICEIVDVHGEIERATSALEDLIKYPALD